MEDGDDESIFGERDNVPQITSELSQPYQNQTNVTIDDNTAISFRRDRENEVFIKANDSHVNDKVANVNKNDKHADTVESSADSDYRSDYSPVSETRDHLNFSSQNGVTYHVTEKREPGWLTEHILKNNNSTERGTWPLAEGSGCVPVSPIPKTAKYRTKDGNTKQENNSTENSITDDDESEKKFSFMSLSRGQKVMLASVCFTNLLCFLSLSILAPFFPLEAENKGVNNTIAGWIFGSFALVQFLTSPFFGRLMPILGSRFMYLAGLFVTGVCTLLFGILDKVDTSEGITVFVTLCIIVRVMLALGCTAVSNAGLIMVVKLFPDNVATVFSLGEVFTGLGMVTGPALGGFLYGAGGFILPFAVIGGCCMMALILIWYNLPPQDDTTEEDDGQYSVWAILLHPKSLINSIVVVIGASIWSILDPTLEPHLRVYGLTPAIIGVLFLIMAAFYSITSPLWGWLCDRLPDNRAVLIPGFVLAAAGLLLLGPSPVLGFDLSYNQLWLSILSLVILGVAASMCVIPTYDIYIDVVSIVGYPEDTRTYGIVSGLWVSMYALGDFAGPTLAGFLYEEIGFEWLATWVAAACLLTALLMLVSWFIEAKCCKHKDDPENTPLIDKDNTTSSSYLVTSQSDTDMLRTYPPFTKDGQSTTTAGV